MHISELNDADIKLLATKYVEEKIGNEDPEALGYLLYKRDKVIRAKAESDLVNLKELVDKISKIITNARNAEECSDYFEVVRNIDKLLVENGIIKD